MKEIENKSQAVQDSEQAIEPESEIPTESEIPKDKEVAGGISKGKEVEEEPEAPVTTPESSEPIEPEIKVNGKEEEDAVIEETQTETPVGTFDLDGQEKTDEQDEEKKDDDSETDLSDLEMDMDVITNDETTVDSTEDDEIEKSQVREEGEGKEVDEEEEFIGFTLEDQCDLIPIVENASLVLFDIVQGCEEEYLKCIAETFTKSETPVEIPIEFLTEEINTEGPNPKVYIEQICVGKGRDAQVYFTGFTKGRQKRNYEAFVEDDDDFDGELTIDEGNSSELNLSIDDEALSYLKSSWTDTELEQLRKPFSIGWTREVILQNLDGSGSAQVTYNSPAGYLVRTYKDLGVVFTRASSGGLNRENFSFSPTPIGSSMEYIQIAPQWLKWIEMNPDMVGGEDVVNIIKKGHFNFQKRFMKRTQKSIHGRERDKRGRFEQMENKKSRTMKNDAGRKPFSGGGGGLFGISALSELFAGIEEADAAREMEDYNHMMNLMAAQENMFEALDPMNTVDTLLDEGEKSGRTQILPCSIRCPGMTGDIPTLQCTRCLCLYHPECLGFSADMDFTNFLCSNCDGNASSDELELEAPKNDSILDFMEKLMDLRKGRPAKKAFGFQQLGKSGISLKRLDANKNLPSPFNRAFKRQGFGKNVPRIPIPQLTTRNVTITPLPLPLKGQLPRVPTLNPINVPKLSSQRPMSNQRSGSGVGLDFLKTNTVRQLSKSPFSQSNTDQQKNTKAHHTLPPNFGASFGPTKPINPELFRKYPQSVITVSSKKFIVIQNPSLCQEAVADSRFGENPEVLGLVFKYLTVKDLLNASRVNNCWKKTASSSSLWKIVRLKNSRIYDLGSFVDFIKARETEIVDFRKILGSIEWAELFTKLHDVESLRTIILGSRTGEVFELAQQHCPNIEVTAGP